MKQSSLILLLILAAALLAGCERGTRDLERWVQETLQRPGEPIDPIPPIRTPDVVAYDAYDLRDPFQRSRQREEEIDPVTGEGTGVRPDPDRRREYLEGFPLDTLAMVGTMRIEDLDWALIRDNEGVVHRVRPGNYMGQNHGQVQRVTGDQVELVELVSDGTGGWIERQVRIALAGTN